MTRESDFATDIYDNINVAFLNAEMLVPDSIKDSAIGTCSM